MSDTWYFANNNSRHFSFDADERFLPLYQFAGDDNKKLLSLTVLLTIFGQVYAGRDDQPLYGACGQ